MSCALSEGTREGSSSPPGCGVAVAGNPWRPWVNFWQLNFNPSLLSHGVALCLSQCLFPSYKDTGHRSYRIMTSSYLHPKNPYFHIRLHSLVGGGVGGVRT